MLEAGLPEGVVNVVTGYGEEAGAPLVAHPDVDKIAFTGSTEVGRQIVGTAAGSLKKVSLELGGKSPNVVYKDADLDTAIAGAANAIFFNHGQCCCAGSRLFAEQDIYDEVVQGVSDHANSIKLGPGSEPDTEMGPLVSQIQLDRVCGLLESGEVEGAETVTGGQRHGEKGFFVEPTVLAGTNPKMRVEAEEIFGPVVTIRPFKSDEDLVPAANESEYGLAAGVWTSDLSKAHRTARRLRAGTVWINCYNVFDATLPFGGYKASGWGREMGAEALELYTEVKSVVAQL
jgi:phenylacetaldehyde dehydrogenase